MVKIYVEVNSTDNSGTVGPVLLKIYSPDKQTELTINNIDNITNNILTLNKGAIYKDGSSSTDTFSVSGNPSAFSAKLFMNNKDAFNIKKLSITYKNKLYEFSTVNNNYTTATNGDKIASDDTVGWLDGWENPDSTFLEPKIRWYNIIPFTNTVVVEA